MENTRAIGNESSYGDLSATTFGIGLMTLAAALACIAAAFPLQSSILFVFLFAGMHNFMEFRYFAARMPLRWGRSRTYYTVAIAGVAVLTSAYLTIFFAGGDWLWGLAGWQTAVSIWNSALVAWVVSLFAIRSRKPYGLAPKALAIAAAAFAAIWTAPALWSIALVYLHPLVALWFLDRQILRTRPEWSPAYRSFLCSIPFVLCGIWMAAVWEPDVVTDSTLLQQIVDHAGAGVFPRVSSHLLVATHVFLESLHYVVWIVLIPLVDKRAVPWALEKIPLFSGKGGSPVLVFAAVLTAALLVLLLWAGFAVDYETTRNIYFALAIAHVLAEFPFLIKMVQQ